MSRAFKENTTIGDDLLGSAGGTENEDSITDWQSARQIGPGLTTLGTWDYKRGGSEQSSIHQGDNGNDPANTLQRIAYATGLQRCRNIACQ